ncbi:hypothetical protein [Nocardia mexicana]|uniref:Secreted protein n=1 Tax=Nocardia mexicana TaxID=279262 RepID=A0A370GRZ1_9NOCA|nr:hypothetical protein [Nocardia mexicana]RDI46468.1 hypothetical protein DFR68_111227 [Nocardia mexicana]
MFKTVLAASALALGVVAGGAATANAEELVVQGQYNTIGECTGAGDFGEVTVDGNPVKLSDGWSYRCDPVGDKFQMTLVR